MQIAIEFSRKETSLNIFEKLLIDFINIKPWLSSNDDIVATKVIFRKVIFSIRRLFEKEFAIS
jgi:hypothetical protein